MAFIIPNAADTVTSPYAVLDQAEPDSLDFEILGNIGRSGVVSGGEVTATGSGGVSVSAGVAVVNGVTYSFSSRTFSLDPSPTDKRFDVVVFRVGTGVTHIVGTESATNPTFPRSKTITGTISDVDFTKDVVLAAVYRSGSVTASQIIDKRVFLTSSIVDQGASAPISTYGAGTGSLYYKTGAADGAASGLYVKSSTAGWVELAQNVGPHVPIGGMIAWPSRSSVPTGFVEANGQDLSTTAYPALFSVLGYTWGGSGTTFKAPNLNNKFVRGTTTTNTVGTNVGGNTVTLSTNQMPSHSHNIAHTHGVLHKHNMEHNHGANSNSTDGSHKHPLGDPTNENGIRLSGGGSHDHPNSTANSGNSAHTHNVAASTVPGGFTFRSHGNTYDGFTSNTARVMFAGVDWNIATYTTNDYYWSTIASNGTANASNDSKHNHGVTIGAANDHTHNVIGEMKNAGSHGHGISVGDSNNTYTSEDTPNTSSISVNTSASAGGTDSVSLIPDSSYIRWIIRASYGTSTSAIGGNSLLDEALEEVVTVELVGSGSLPASQTGAAYYRMPWAATLTGVKANLNSNTTSAISIDINEGGTSVLSTGLTIDAGESSSKTAATPAVISDPIIADDALLTFDIDSADTGDSGPLTVTLYFTREP